jgi:hypothetical protein
VKALSRNLALILVAVLSIPAAGAQAAPKKDASPKPPSSPSQSLLDSWNDIGRKLIAMAEDFPEDKYDFKPAPAQRSFAEQLLHAAGSNYFFINQGGCGRLCQEVVRRGRCADQEQRR